MPATVIYVDVDDTFVRTFGTKRMPMPAVIRHIRALHEMGAALYCWSSGGADYAKASAEEFGLTDCFMAFLPKPNVVQGTEDWHPMALPENLLPCPLDKSERSE